MAAAVLVEMDHQETHRMEVQLGITQPLHQVLQEMVLQIQVAVGLERQMVMAVPADPELS
jgi:hypothetical protein